jgi:hypothetical protein
MQNIEKIQDLNMLTNDELDILINQLDHGCLTMLHHIKDIGKAVKILQIQEMCIDIIAQRKGIFI